MKILLATCLATLSAIPMVTPSFAGETISEEEAWKLGWPAMQGHAQAQYNLERMYADGKGVAQNRAEEVNCIARQRSREMNML